MKFIQNSDLEACAHILADRIEDACRQKQRVLWLVTGGSGIPLGAAAMSLLPDEVLPNLAIMLTDERYGEVGHKDSNVRQLEEAGFDPRGAIFIPTLQKRYATLEATAQGYELAVKESFKHADFIIGQFGMGADGHIAGILPNTVAAEEAEKLVVGYETEQFDRITLTFKAIEQVNVAYLFAYGEAKQSALLNLRDQNLDLTVQPAQIISKLPEAYVYNDQIGPKE